MNVTAHTQQLIAPAKLTLSLRIRGLRSDGFHLIEAIMTTLELHDVLTVIDDSRGLSFRGPFAEGLKNDASNLVTRALTFVQRSANIVVTKIFPMEEVSEVAQQMLRRFFVGQAGLHPVMSLIVRLSVLMFPFVSSVVRLKFLELVKSSNQFHLSRRELP